MMRDGGAPDAGTLDAVLGTMARISKSGGAHRQEALEALARMLESMVTVDTSRVLAQRMAADEDPVVVNLIANVLAKAADGHECAIVDTLAGVVRTSLAGDARDAWRGPAAGRVLVVLRHPMSASVIAHAAHQDPRYQDLLAQVSAIEAVPVLVRLLHDSEERNVSQAAAEALGRCGTPGRAELRSWLEQHLASCQESRIAMTLSVASVLAARASEHVDFEILDRVGASHPRLRRCIAMTMHVNRGNGRTAGMASYLAANPHSLYRKQLQPTSAMGSA
jgi:hypothetical protein